MAYINNRTPHDAETAEAMMIAKGAVTLMNDLASVMHEESNVLESQKMETHPDLLKRKQRLTLDYRAMMKSLSNQPDLLKKLPEESRAEVRAASQKLADVSDRNARILRVSVMGAQQLLQSIIRIVKTETLPTKGYANPKAQAMALGVYSPTCQPVAVNRTA